MSQRKLDRSAVEAALLRLGFRVIARKVNEPGISAFQNDFGEYLVIAFDRDQIGWTALTQNLEFEGVSVDGVREHLADLGAFDTPSSHD